MSEVHFIRPAISYKHLQKVSVVIQELNNCPDQNDPLTHKQQSIFNLNKNQDNIVNIRSERTNSKKHMSATQKTAFTTTVKAAFQEEALFPRHFNCYSLSIHLP